MTREQILNEIKKLDFDLEFYAGKEYQNKEMLLEWLKRAKRNSQKKETLENVVIPKQNKKGNEMKTIKADETKTIKANSINDTLENKNIEYVKLTNNIKRDTLTKKGLILDLISIMIKDSKNQIEALPYGYNKKGALILSKIKLEKTLHKDFKAVIKAVYIYLVSKSKINFNEEITKGNFIKSMNLLNLDNNEKYNSNKQLLEAVKMDKMKRDITKAKKLLSK